MSRLAKDSRSSLSTQYYGQSSPVYVAASPIDALRRVHHLMHLQGTEAKMQIHQELLQFRPRNSGSLQRSTTGERNGYSQEGFVDSALEVQTKKGQTAVDLPKVTRSLDSGTRRLKRASTQGKRNSNPAIPALSLAPEEQFRAEKIVYPHSTKIRTRAISSSSNSSSTRSKPMQNPAVMRTIAMGTGRRHSHKSSHHVSSKEKSREKSSSRAKAHRRSYSSDMDSTAAAARLNVYGRGRSNRTNHDKREAKDILRSRSHMALSSQEKMKALEKTEVGPSAVVKSVSAYALPPATRKALQAMELEELVAEVPTDTGIGIPNQLEPQSAAKPVPVHTNAKKVARGRQTSNERKKGKTKNTHNASSPDVANPKKASRQKSRSPGSDTRRVSKSSSRTSSPQNSPLVSAQPRLARTESTEFEKARIVHWTTENPQATATPFETGEDAGGYEIGPSSGAVRFTPSPRSSPRRAQQFFIKTNRG